MEHQKTSGYKLFSSAHVAFSRLDQTLRQYRIKLEIHNREISGKFPISLEIKIKCVLYYWVFSLYSTWTDELKTAAVLSVCLGQRAL